MSRHTPGPWNMVESDDRTGWMIGPGDTDGQDYVADVHKLVRGRSDADSEANARLIAAAPDMESALLVQRDALNACIRYLLGTGPQPQPEDMAGAVSAGEAAIAKTRGGQMSTSDCCSGHAVAYAPSAWAKLPLVGYQVEEDESGSPVTRHEMRQCPDCKSTLTVPYEVRDPASGAWVLAS